ncbi:MAG: hypothetical protein KDL87_19535, partial [Verrucomicrobiae bacterium]|nr:hypothetical protein [Verrucomicrobiae bacterium]
MSSSSSPRRSGNRSRDSGGKPPKPRGASSRKSRGRKAAEPPAGWSLLSPLTLWGMRRPWLQGLLAVAGFTLGVLIIAGIGVFLHYDRQAAKFDLSQVARMPQESRVYDVQGREIGFLHGDGRTVVPLEKISPMFQQALV